MFYKVREAEKKSQQKIISKLKQIFFLVVFIENKIYKKHFEEEFNEFEYKTLHVELKYVSQNHKPEQAKINMREREVF